MFAKSLLILVALAGAGGGAAVEGRDPITDSLSREPPAFMIAKMSKATNGTDEIMLLGSAAVNPDCTPSGHRRPMVVRRAPEHGQVRIVAGMFFVPFTAPNPRVACNRRRVPAQQAYYVAEAGFTGHDTVVLEQATFDGHVRQVAIDVEVR